VNDELVMHRNKFRLVSASLTAFESLKNLDQFQDNPHFYATRNRIRKFVEKLCSSKMPESAQVILKNKTPLQPIDTPSRRSALSGTTDDDDEEVETAMSQNEELSPTSDQSQSSSSPQQLQQHRNFKEQLEQILAKPAARVPASLGKTLVQMHQARPVPLPRKRVMFNTLGSGKSINDDEEDK